MTNSLQACKGHFHLLIRTSGGHRRVFMRLDLGGCGSIFWAVKKILCGCVQKELELFHDRSAR
jgi:hypothetical protein